MPIYEYRCESCSAEFEEFVRPGDEEPEECPECSESTVTRLISNTTFKLKGSGWYETDYARADQPGDATSDPAGDRDDSAVDDGGENSSDDSTS